MNLLLTQELLSINGGGISLSCLSKLFKSKVTKIPAGHRCVTLTHQSPYMYNNRFDAIQEIKRLNPTAFNIRASRAHHSNHADGNGPGYYKCTFNKIVPN